MADTDPFGREKDDDPLAQMGWTSSAASTGAEVAQPEQPDRAVRRSARREPAGPVSVGMPRGPVSIGMPGRRRRRRGVGCAFTLFALLFVGSMAATVIPTIVDQVEEIDDAIPRVPTVPAVPGTPPGDDGEQARPPRGLSGASLLRRDNLTRAMRRLQRVTGARSLMLARVDAESVIVQTPAGAGRTRFARATWQGDASVLSTSPGGGVTTFPWSRLDASAPARIVRATTRGRPSRFDYAVLTDVVELQWTAFLKGGRGFTATLDGRSVRPLGG